MIYEPDKCPEDYGPEDAVIEALEKLRGDAPEVADECRRALLSHLLEAEGLPELEEIKGLRRVIADVAFWAQERHYEPDWDELGGILRQEWHDTARQNTLRDLLEAEAAERVERVDDFFTEFCPKGEKVFISIHPEKAPIDFRCPIRAGNYETLENLMYCCAAALAEKRKREGHSE